MPQIAHYHDFTQTNDGFKCQLPNCTVSMTQAVLAANLLTASAGMGNKHISLSDMLNYASKKSGNS